MKQVKDTTTYHLAAEIDLEMVTIPKGKFIIKYKNIKDLSANINPRNPIQNLFFSLLFTVMPENSCTVRASS